MAITAARRARSSWRPCCIFPVRPYGARPLPGKSAEPGFYPSRPGFCNVLNEYADCLILEAPVVDSGGGEVWPDRLPGAREHRDGTCAYSPDGRRVPA